MHPPRFLSIIPLLAALLAACFLPECVRIPERHAQIAMTGGDYAKAMMTVPLLDDQAPPADVAASAGTRREAAGTPTAASQLPALSAREAVVSEPARLAVARALDDQAEPEKSARDNKDADDRREAPGRLPDRPAPAYVAKNPKNEPMRPAALEKPGDQGLSTKIVWNNKSGDAPMAALKKRHDPRVPAGIAGAGESMKADYDTRYIDNAIRTAALEKITDQAILAGMAMHDKNKDIAWAALKKLHDPQVLAALVRPGNSAEARLWAAWRLADRELLDGIARRDTEERVRNAASARLAGAQKNAARADLADLIREGKVLARIGGGDIQHLYISLKKMTPWPLEVLIPAGTYFVCDNPEAQDMVSTEDVPVVLEEADYWNPRIPVACASRPKKIPEATDVFSIGSLPDDAELKCLMTVLKGKDAPYATKQAAIWIVTDNAGYDDLGSLQTSRDGRVLRTITEIEAAEAMQLCVEAGIDIKKKNIWNDRVKIFAGLPEGH
ncbi:hypothetical protein OH491_02830 [Termitidicoccus mucosus]|uniref:Uncharacterized protein n=1 Tax=Termitidicoccus mucosus TaxID=1184151 RepID=A0A178ILI5_9BACT|nr:hypothetical protein AW736_06720 [Opitutaceae bacterium TSB47]